jgi:hypothetical protein
MILSAVKFCADIAGENAISSGWQSEKERTVGI